MKSIFTSRKFIALVISLIFIVVMAFFPGFPDIEENITELAVLVGAYIFGSAIDPRTHWQNKLAGIFHSQKFWAVIAGLAFLFIKQVFPDVPFTEEQVTAAIITLSTFIIGKGLNDKITSGMSTQDKARANSQ